jgi:DNA-binding transcriptional LysR family regulator
VPCAGATPTWTGFWRLEPHPDGTPAPIGPEVVETFEDKLELIADGQAIAILPAGDRRSTLRDDVSTIPIEGIEPCQVVVVTRANDRNPLVVHFRKSVRNLLVGDA